VHELFDMHAEILVSEEILDELEDVIARPRLRIDAPDARRFIVVVRQHASIIKPSPVAVCADPDDDKFLACALEGQADLLISGDNALLALDGWRGMRVCSPRTALTLLRAWR
jgi:putative PIN family toxin of toxin-antitoxin system